MESTVAQASHALLPLPAEAAQRSPGPEEEGFATLVSYSTLANAGDSISRAACTMLAYYRSLECSRSLALRLLVRARRALPRPATMVPLAGHRGGVLQVGHLIQHGVPPAAPAPATVRWGMPRVAPRASRRGVHVPGEERRAHGVVCGGRGARLGLLAYTFSRACHALPPPTHPRVAISPACLPCFDLQQARDGPHCRGGLPAGVQYRRAARAGRVPRLARAARGHGGAREALRRLRLHQERLCDGGCGSVACCVCVSCGCLTAIQETNKPLRR